MLSEYVALSVELCPEEGSELAAWRPDVVKSLLDILRDVTLDPEQGAAFDADPNHYLAEQGYSDVGDDDLREAFSLVADTLPAEQAHDVYTTHVATEASGVLEPFSVQEDDPGAVYGHPTDDFDLDIDDAVNKVIDPDVDDADDADADDADDADDGGLGFGNGADDDDLDIAAMHMPDPDDEHLVVDDPAFDSHDDLDDHKLDDIDDHDADDLDLDLDLNPFDHSHDQHGLDDDATTSDQHGMHHPETDEGHDTGHHDDGLDDFDLGLF